MELTTDVVVEVQMTEEPGFVWRSDQMLLVIREGKADDAAMWASGLARQYHSATTPDWDEFDRQNKHVNDWRSYISHELRALWDTLTPLRQCAIQANADQIASREEWD